MAMYDREPRIEDFPLRSVPAPDPAQKAPGVVPKEYYSQIGTFWSHHNVFICTLGTLVIVFLIGALTAHIPGVGLIFGLALIGVLIGFPVSAFVSRKNARLKYEKDIYDRQVTQYQQEVAQAQREQEAAFRKAHDLWMTQQSQVRTPPVMETVNSELVDRFISSSVTYEIVGWIKSEWENYGRNRALDPQVQSLETFCEGTVEKDNVGVKFSLKGMQDAVIRKQYKFAEHKTQSLGTDENCAAVSAALASLLQNMNIDNTPVSVISQNGKVFVARRTAPNPNYEPSFRGW